LYLQKAFGCENATTRLDCFKLNSTIDDSLNDFGGESRLTCGLNQRHLGYASWRQNKLVKKIYGAIYKAKTLEKEIYEAKN
jgi:hypothetical protein